MTHGIAIGWRREMFVVISCRVIPAASRSPKVTGASSTCVRPGSGRSRAATVSAPGRWLPVGVAPEVRPKPTDGIRPTSLKIPTATPSADADDGEQQSGDETGPPGQVVLEEPDHEDRDARSGRDHGVRQPALEGRPEHRPRPRAAGGAQPRGDEPEESSHRRLRLEQREQPAVLALDGLGELAAGAARASRSRRRRGRARRTRPPRRRSRRRRNRPPSAAGRRSRAHRPRGGRPRRW